MYKMDSDLEPDFEKQGGLVPVIVQDATSGMVLMLAYSNRLAWQETLSSGFAHYWSRSRQQLWKKGESSGHLQRIKRIAIDCDKDTLLFTVDSQGGIACHTGAVSCFYREIPVPCLLK